MAKLHEGQLQKIVNEIETIHSTSGTLYGYQKEVFNLLSNYNDNQLSKGLQDLKRSIRNQLFLP